MTFNTSCVYPDNICNCADCEGFLAIASLIEDDYDQTHNQN